MSQTVREIAERDTDDTARWIKAEDATPLAHVYTSTACQHGLHDRCRKACKFCGVACACSCHATEATPPAQEHPDTETRAEMLDRIADEESEALMPGGFNG